MAKLVDFRQFTPQDAREDVVRRVQEAPMEHAEAVLAGYDFLQRLHEKGVLGLLNGLLSAGDTVVDHVVNVVSSKEVVTMLRTTLILGNVLSSIDPDKVHGVLATNGKEPPSLLALAKQAFSKDARRGLAFVTGLLSVLGQALNRPGLETEKQSH
jgi:uncharacterized protein YjgD (DUF1641 family)